MYIDSYFLILNDIGMSYLLSCQILQPVVACVHTKHRAIICDMIEENESDVGNIDFELQA